MQGIFLGLLAVLAALPATAQNFDFGRILNQGVNEVIRAINQPTATEPARPVYQPSAPELKRAPQATNPGARSQRPANAKRIRASALDVGGMSAEAGQPCRTVPAVKPGSAVAISGSVEAEGIDCYLLSGVTGRTMRIQVKSANSIFTIPDVVDAQDNYQFVAKRESYEIWVIQLMRAVTPDDYELTISVR